MLSVGEDVKATVHSKPISKHMYTLHIAFCLPLLSNSVKSEWNRKKESLKRDLKTFGCSHKNYFFQLCAKKQNGIKLKTKYVSGEYKRFSIFSDFDVIIIIWAARDRPRRFQSREWISFCRNKSVRPIIR